ncbi:MAG: SDR family NAD(P)-dependent oxidoreductase [Saprospiraceae bacterium]
MSTSHPEIILAYSRENEATARRIDDDLSDVARFRHVAVDTANEGPVLSDLLPDSGDYLVLLVSDNFLRNPNAMFHANRMLHGDWEVLPIVLDGRRPLETGEGTARVKTEVANVADIMGYINHWQDRYLDLRAQRREMAAEVGRPFEDYLRKIREVSGQIGEFMRNLRTTIQLTLPQFKADDYRQFFIFVDLEDTWENRRREAAARPRPEPVEIELTDEELAQIPGLNLLPREDSEPSAAIIVPGPAPEEEEPDQTARPAAAGEKDQTARPETDDARTYELEDYGDETPAERLEQQSADDNKVPEPDPADELDRQVIKWVQQAWGFYDNGEPEDAFRLLRTGLENYPERMDLRYHLALMLVNEPDKLPEARKHLDRVLAVVPDHVDALFLLGELSIAQRDGRSALDALERVAQLEPTYPELNYRLGSILQDYYPQENERAAALLKAAAKHDPDNADAQLRYAKLLIDPLDKPSKAEKYLRRALLAEPRLMEAHHLSAELKRRAGPGRDTEAVPPMPPPEPISLPVPPPSPAPTPNQPNMPTSSAYSDTNRLSDPLSALKENVAQLEALLQDRRREQEESKWRDRPGAGKTVLISGATAGIGRATAERFAREGYRLILTGRREDRLVELSRRLTEEQRTEVYTISFDVTDREAVQAAVNQLPEEWRTVDILINNAGKARGFEPIQEGDPANWDEMIDTNIKGLLYLTRAVTPAMVRRGAGFIINLCSTAGKEVYPNGGVYCATKHAVDALTRAMRYDLVKHGIRVGQVCPAAVEETEFAMVRFDGDAERAAIYGDFKPLTSSDVAETIYFMAGQPPHVNIMDVVMQGQQQASALIVDRSGREEE